MCVSRFICRVLLPGYSEMNSRGPTALLSAFFLLVSLWSSVSAAQPQGVVGFTVEVDGDGSFWKPIIKRVIVESVRPGSPAEAAGLLAGDEILLVQGAGVADANARKVAELVQVVPGEHLLLVVRGAAGKLREIDIIAGGSQEEPLHDTEGTSGH